MDATTDLTTRPETIAAAPERCAVVVADALSGGHAANAAAVVTAMLAVRTPGLLGPDVRDADGVPHPGVVLVPVPVLVAPVDRLAQLWRDGTGDPVLVCAGFTALAQSCRTYQEYLDLMAAARTDDLRFVAVGLAGPRRPVNRLAGSLPLLR